MAIDLERLIAKAKSWLNHGTVDEDPSEIVQGLLDGIERQGQHVKDQDHLLACYRAGKRPSEKVLDRMTTYEESPL